MFDTWGRNYNFRMLEDTRDQIEASFERLRQIGAAEVYVHDFLRAVYEKDTGFVPNLTTYSIEGDIFLNDKRDQEISPQELKKLAERAHEKGMRIAWRTNLGFIDFGKYIGSSDISGELAKDWQEFDLPKSKEWVEDFLNKWEAALLQKADLLNKAGFDIMILTPHGMNPQYHPFEKLANSRWKEIIGEIKKSFNGQVGVMVDKYAYAGEKTNEDWALYDFYREADLVYYQMDYVLPKYQPSAQPDFAQMKDKLKLYVNDLEKRAGKDGIKLSLIFGFPSYRNAILTGYVEFSDVLNPAIQEIEADNLHQAEATEALLQILEGRKNIEKIVMFGYWWDDFIDEADGPKDFLKTLPQPRLSISPSARNKPAEAVFRKWARSWAKS